ncbi:hypothetical protein ACFL3X_01045, partial [Gemmatimonadota bacterium]
MQRSRTVISFCLFTASILVSGCAGPMKNTGSFNWPVGTAVLYSIETEQISTAVIPMGETRTTETESAVLKVEAVDPEVFEMTIVEATRESDASEREQGERVFARTLTGLSSLVRLDDRGLIIDASDLADNPAVTDHGGSEVVIEYLQHCFLYLPEIPLKPEVEWIRDYTYAQSQTDFPLNFHHVDSFRCIGEVTIQGIPAWAIEVTSRVELSGGSLEGNRSLSLSGEGQGIIHVARETGMLLDLESARVLDGQFWVMDQ